MLGVCNGVNNNSNAHIGQFAVKPQYHGLGIGSALWKKVMQHIGTERNISLYATESMFPIYRDKYGFGVIPEKRIHLYEGKVNCDHLVKHMDDISVININEYNIKSVVEYDKAVCQGLDRSTFIEEYSKCPQTIALTAIHKKSNQVMGYCIITTTNNDMSIVEPLYADNEIIAELLVCKCIQLLPISITNGITLQVWDFNEKAIAMAKKMGLNFTAVKPILFTKHLIEGKIEKIFCVSSRSFYPF